MILLIDNYDSFSYNLVQMAGSLAEDIRVVRNDEVSVEEIGEMSPTHIILSPGPGYPKDAGICKEVIEKLQGRIPILGVCLGHQAICEVYGARIVHAKELMHGKKSLIHINRQTTLFKGMADQMEAARYHSLIAEGEKFPEVLRVTARDNNGEVMAVEHKKYPVFGVQFHPESIMTPEGEKVMRNFLNSQHKQEDTK